MKKLIIIVFLIFGVLLPAFAEDDTKTILSKVFDKSVNDRFAVIDYAGNYTMVDVKIYM